MTPEAPTEILRNFKLDNKEMTVLYKGSDAVCEGVMCNVYDIEGDSTRDLAIVQVEAGCETPLQEITEGESTIEGYVSGRGTLIVFDSDGVKKEYKAGYKSNEISEIATLKVGDFMQWKASESSELKFYEICSPAYKFGRYNSIS